MTLAPQEANNTLIAAPIPLLPPVITAVFPLKSKFTVSRFLYSLLILGRDEQLDIVFREHTAILVCYPVIGNDHVDIIQTCKMGDADFAELCGIGDQDDLPGRSNHLPLDIRLIVKVGCQAQLRIQPPRGNEGLIRPGVADQSPVLAAVENVRVPVKKTSQQDQVGVFLG